MNKDKQRQKKMQQAAKPVFVKEPELDEQLSKAQKSFKDLEQFCKTNPSKKKQDIAFSENLVATGVLMLNNNVELVHPNEDSDNQLIRIASNY